MVLISRGLTAHYFQEVLPAKMTHTAKLSIKKRFAFETYQNYN